GVPTGRFAFLLSARSRAFPSPHGRTKSAARPTSLPPVWEWEPRVPPATPSSGEVAADRRFAGRRGGGGGRRLLPLPRLPRLLLRFRLPLLVLRGRQVEVRLQTQLFMKLPRPTLVLRRALARPRTVRRRRHLRRNRTRRRRIALLKRTTIRMRRRRLGN